MGGQEKLTEKPNTVIGILAHVDAGKTTLAEGLLFTAGALRKQGRVDHGNTLLDSHALEKERGITIFSSEAHFTWKDRRFTLLDTPGHVDFSAEMERTLSVLDAAVLVVSATDGVQAHTRTLWRLLSLYGVPTFLFVTKMDYARYAGPDLLKALQKELGDGLCSFSEEAEIRDENIATLDEEAMNVFLETGAVPPEKIRELIGKRLLIPVYFGSGLRLQGLTEFLDGLFCFTEVPSYGDAFRARVFKILHDASGNKIAHLKLLGGVLSVRDTVKTGLGEEKISRIYLNNGEKETAVDRAKAGDTVSVLGLSQVKCNDELGEKGFYPAPVLEPVMRYRLEFPEGTDILSVLPKLRQLEEEAPELNLSWNEALREIQVGLMGEVQAEVLQVILSERLEMPVRITKGHVLYKETVRGLSEGVGHYEPLRHYAEVHLLLEPLPRGSGLKFVSAVKTDDLDLNWQRLVLQHLIEKEHPGVLTGSPITDIKITLTAGRAHLKHTEGGDFRQATYRAVRQGLMQAESLLLEPWYRFRLELPENLLSRAVNDIRAMSGTFLPPFYENGEVLISGRAPVSEMNDYQKTLNSYSGGRGKLILDADGYDLCHETERVLRDYAYDPEKDTANSPDSVFCAHGVGFLVKWDKVPEYMHLESTLSKRQEPKALRKERNLTHVSDSELEEIMLREFGPIRRPQYQTGRPPNRAESTGEIKKKPQILIVDGYNVIFAWDFLRALSASDIQAARDRLQQILVNFSAFRDLETVLVFDGYRVPGNKGERFINEKVRVVFTPEKESGDLYIERLIGKLSANNEVRVVTSDNMIQLSALRKGVLRISSQEFETLVQETEEEISDLLARRKERSRERLGDTEVLEKVELQEDKEET